MKAMSELLGAPLEPRRSRLTQHPRCLAEDPRLCAGCRLTSVLRAEVATGFSQLLIKAVSSPSALSPSPSPRPQLHLMSPPTQQLVFLQVEERDEPLTTV